MPWRLKTARSFNGKGMSSLFALEPVLPPEFTYLPDFITEKEEYELASVINAIPLRNMIFQGFEAKRKVASFGFDYHFDTRNLTAASPIPTEFQWLVERIAACQSLNATALAKMLLTEYPVSSVINWHRDAPPFELIAGISLLSDCTFKLRPYDKTKKGRASIISFPVARRSLYIMQGVSRHDWEHSISPVKQKRYSITLRTLRDKP